MTLTFLYRDLSAMNPGYAFKSLPLVAQPSGCALEPIASNTSPLAAPRRPCLRDAFAARRYSTHFLSQRKSLRWQGSRLQGFLGAAYERVGHPRSRTSLYGEGMLSTIEDNRQVQSIENSVSTCWVPPLSPFFSLDRLLPPPT